MTKNSKAKEAVELLEKYGTKACPGFRLTDQNSVPLMSLMEYFREDKEFEERDDSYSLKKGLLIQGDVGTGKTVAIRLFQHLLRTRKEGFKMIATRHVVREFIIQGEAIIEEYGRKSYKDKNLNGTPRIFCFDDLGLEETDSKVYGNKRNVMAEILFDRYEEFCRTGMKTYATTNLDATGLEAAYGMRIRDRFREIFNIIQFKGDSFRK